MIKGRPDGQATINYIQFNQLSKQEQREDGDGLIYIFAWDICREVHYQTCVWINNYLLTGNKVQLYFPEMNSRYFIFRAKREK